MKSILNNTAPHTELYNFLSKEGRKSQEMFTGLLRNAGRLRGVRLNAEGNVAFKINRYPVVQNLKRDHPRQFRQMVNASLGRAGLHRVTCEYSIYGEVESDHPIPCNVWRDTTNPRLKNYAPGNVGRPGARVMPAMTIPEAIHSQLRTTIDPNFSIHLCGLCNANRIPDAIRAVMHDQQDKGLPFLSDGVDIYRNGWEIMLREFQAMNIINNNELNVLINYLNDL